MAERESVVLEYDDGSVVLADVSELGAESAFGGPSPVSVWKTSYDVPGGNGITKESRLMQLEESIDFLMQLAREWGQVMPGLADVDPKMPGIGGVVVDGEHIQGPPRMLAGTLHGDCADFLVNSGAIFEARRELGGGPGDWSSPFGEPLLFEQPDAAQDHIAWADYDHLADRPRQLGGWFDTIKKLARRVSPEQLQEATSRIAPWATPLIARAKPYVRQVRKGWQQLQGAPPYSGRRLATRRRVPQRRNPYKASFTTPGRRATPWARFPTSAPAGRSPLYLPPASTKWNMSFSR